MADETGGGPTIGDRLRSDDAARCVAAMVELVDRESPATEDEIDALVGCLNDTRKIVQRRAAESLAVLQRRGAGVDAKVRLLAHAGWPGRWGAVYALSIMDSLEPDGIETLVEALGLADRDVRWAAVDVLKKLAGRHREAVVARAITLGNRGSPVQRRMAFYLLRDLAVCEDAAINAAIEAIGTADSSLRLAALAALAVASRVSAEVVGRIAALVSDPDLPVARAAAATLGSLGSASPPAVAALRAALQGADSTLRRAAETALRRLQAPHRPE